MLLKVPQKLAIRVSLRSILVRIFSRFYVKIAFIALCAQYKVEQGDIEQKFKAEEQHLPALLK